MSVSYSRTDNFKMNGSAELSPLDHQLLRVFNTAIIATRVGDSDRDLSGALMEIVSTPAFKAILAATRELALSQGISEKEAASTIIETFRQVDKVWSDYVFREGVERLKGGGAASSPSVIR